MLAPGRGLRLAFAGAGHWHLTVDARYLDLAREAECEIVGLSDDDERVARERAELVGCPWTTDPVDLVERFKPDLVLATPRPDRAPGQIRVLLDTGVPLFAEKPLGLRAEDVWPLVEPAERGWVTVAFQFRVLPLWQRLEQLRAEQGIGELLHVHLRLVKGSPARYREFGVPWMLKPSVGGGGPIRNFGIHFADLLNWQLGPRRLQVTGASLTHRPYDHDIEAFGAAVLQAEDGPVVTLEVGYTLATTSFSDFEVRLATEGAYLIQRGPRLEVYRPKAEPQVSTLEPGHSFYRELFFDALGRLRHGDPPLATVRDCALANEIVDAIYDAAGRQSLVTTRGLPSGDERLN